MARKTPDLIGKKVGRLIVLDRDGLSPRNERLWRCRCECGTILMVGTGRLNSSHIKSCGCLQRDLIASLNRTHGLSGTTEHRIWKHLNNRCYNPNNPKFPRYGGRGVKVCDRWRNDFRAFLDDMGPRPKGASIDRINNDGDYEPANCRWATPKQQSNNTRRNYRIEHDGRRLTISQWAREVNLPPVVLWLRLRRYHWPVERALTEPRMPGRRAECAGH